MAIRITDAYKPGYNRINLDMVGKSGPPDTANKRGSPILSQAMAEMLGMKSTSKSPWIPGSAWVNRVTPLAGVAKCVAYGAGDRYVALTSASTKSWVSTDCGLTWTVYDTGMEANDWRGIAYLGGLYVAVAKTGTNRVMTSPDGITWTVAPVPGTYTWTAITSMGGKLVAVSADGHVMTSVAPATSWTLQTCPSGGWTCVTYGSAGGYVAMADQGTNRCMTSPDGVTWTARVPVQSPSFVGVAYGNSVYVAVAVYQLVNYEVLTSPDGITWTQQTLGTKCVPTGIAFGNGRFTVVCSPYNDGGTYGGPNGVTNMTSTNGVTWAQRYDPMGSFNAICYGGGTTPRFVAVGGGYVYRSGYNGPQVQASFDGITWTAQMDIQDNSWQSVAYGNGKFAAVSPNGSQPIMTSTDGVTWTPQPGAAYAYWQCIAFGAGLFVALGQMQQSRQVMTSPDGVTWTERSSASNDYWQAITYANGQFVAVGSNCCMTSPDGITWTSRTIPAGVYWSVTYGAGKFVAVANYVAVYSTDGITWLPCTGAVVAASYWYAVAYGAGRFVACANTGVMMTSTDGIAWTTLANPTSNAWSAILFCETYFVAVCGGSSPAGQETMTSPDGLVWTVHAAVPNAWSALAYGNGIVVAVSPHARTGGSVGAAMTSISP